MNNVPEDRISADQLVTAATQEGLPELLLTPDLQDALDKTNVTLKNRALIVACQQEVRFIQEVLAPMLGGNEQALETITGRISMLQELAVSTVSSLYPDVKPVDINFESPGITREEQNALATAIEFGEYEKLTTEKLPFLKYLGSEAVYRIQRQALDNLISWWGDEETKSQPKLNINQEEPSLRNILANRRLTHLSSVRDQMIENFSNTNPELFPEDEAA